MAPNAANSRRTPTAFEISQLHDKPAAQWERKIRELEAEKNFRILEYLPLRKAIIAELETPGAGNDALTRELEGYNSGFSTEAMVQAMKAGFSVFLSKQRKYLTKIYIENVRRSEPFLVRIGGGQVKVTLHGEVEHSRHGRGSLFIYASQYSQAEVNALQELLGMVAEQRDARSPENVFWLDIRKGQMTRLKSRSSVRNSIAETVKHYNRLF